MNYFFSHIIYQLFLRRIPKIHQIIKFHFLIISSKNTETKKKPFGNNDKSKFVILRYQRKTKEKKKQKYKLLSTACGTNKYRYVYKLCADNLITPL